MWEKARPDIKFGKIVDEPMHKIFSRLRKG
jgi:hypothetical protein